MATRTVRWLSGAALKPILWLMVHQNFCGARDVACVPATMRHAVASGLPLGKRQWVQLQGILPEQGTLADAHARKVRLFEVLILLRFKELSRRTGIGHIASKPVVVRTHQFVWCF